MAKKRKKKTPKTELPPELSGITHVRLARLAATNILRIRAVQIDFDESGLVVIEAKNQQGKTSLMKALEMCIAGSATAPPDPIHGDEDEGQAIATFKVYRDDQDEPGKLIVRRIITKDKPPKLTIHLEGIRRALPRPAEILDILLDHIALNIMQFAKMPGDEKAKVLADLMGYDASALDHQRQAAFDERREVKRDVDRLQNEYEALTHHEDTPEEELVISELLAEVESRQAHNAKGDKLKTEAETAVANLEQAEKELKAAQEALRLAEQCVSTQELIGREALQLAEDFEYEDIDELKEKIDDAEAINAKVRENDQREKKRIAFMKAKEEADELSAKIEQLDNEKRAKLQEAQERLPVKGLGIKDGAVTYNGKPFEQAGDSATIITSTAISIALNKDRPLKFVQVDNAEQMDFDTRKTVKQMVRDAGFQMMMTMVQQGEKPGRGSVVIEDGTVIEVRDEDRA